MVGDDTAAEFQRWQGAAGAHQQARRQYIRCLLVAGAVAVLRHTRNRTTKDAAWVRGLLVRRPTKVAAVALANKTARIAWAVMTRGDAYRSTTEIVQAAA